MIVQCGQCNTKFRLDDARVKDFGVKVRCSKCRHIFMVYRETRQEDSDFDRLLSGLDATAAGEAKMPPPPSGALKAVPVEQPAELASEPAASTEIDEWQNEAPEFTVFPEETSVSGNEIDFDLPSGREAETAPDIATTRETVTWGEGESDGFNFTESQEELDSERIAPAASEVKEEDFPVSEFGEASVAEFEFYETDPGIQEREASEAPDSFGGMAADEDFFLETAEDQASTNGPEAEDTPFPISQGDEPASDVSHEAIEQFVNAGAGTEAAMPSGKVTEGAAVPIGAGAGEELPPLPISTRRASSGIPVVIIAICVVFVVILAGLGVFLFTEGPESLNRMGLGQLAKWTGLENGEGGNITLQSTTATFVANKEVGELFVVSGEALNNFSKPRASIQIRALVYGPKGEVLMRRTAYCGNKLTKEQLANLPMPKIEAAMNNQFGDSLCNLGVAPGKTIPFIAVFSKIPKEASEYGVEVAGSTVAGQ